VPDWETGVVEEMFKNIACSEAIKKYQSKKKRR